MDNLIKKSKNVVIIRNEIENDFVFDDETFNQIDLIVQNKKDTILDYLNKDFNSK